MAVYIIECGPGGPVKVGRSADPVRRLRDLQAACPAPLELLAVITAGDDRDVEAQLHRRLREHRIHGEWFERSDPVELLIAEVRGPHRALAGFEWLCSRDARLERLATSIRDYASQAGRLPTVCAEVDWERRFAPQLERLAGWGRPAALGDEVLGTRAALDLAERGLRALLPACRGCLHAHVSA